MHLSTVVVTEAESTLTVETVSPEATKVDISLTELGVSDDQPGAEDGLSKDIKDGVGDDLAIDTDATGTVSETPNAAVLLVVVHDQIKHCTHIGYAVQRRRV